ncbi:hypothetical protein QQ045_017809 [Rhodiola kirilowii]
MKKEFNILAMLISGPKSPRKCLNVFMQPLIDELNTLWEIGVPTFDRHDGSTFKMKAAVISTISDFPGLGMLGGLKCKGYKACPMCLDDIDGQHLAGRIFYQGHRRWLGREHPWRYAASKFNGEVELQDAPTSLTGEEIFSSTLSHDYAILSLHPNLKPRGGKDKLCWTHVSIFYQLPYWSNLSQPYLLDVMHIEKNVFDNIIGTILGLQGKTKDDVKAREGWEKKGSVRNYGGREKVPHHKRTRQLGEYKRSVRNSRYPEGCIAEQYVTQECVTYCKLYLNETAMGSSDEVPLYSLEVYSPLIKIQILKGQGSSSYCKVLHSLARMPKSYECFSQCNVNGVKFVVWDRDRKMKTQNSGVMVEDGHVTYYGVIRNIVQLRYANGMLVVLFDCIWFNTDPTERGSIKRDYGLISIDTSTSCYEDWPYCLATTARQVFYLDDLKAGDSWKVVNVVAQRGTYSQRSLARHDEGSSDTHAVLISRQDHENPYQEDMPLHIAIDLQPMDPNLDETPKRALR